MIHIYLFIIYLIIYHFRNLENWSVDTLVTLSDLLIVLNQDQLDSIPKISRLNFADIIQTRYADEIEWLSNNIPFYQVSGNTNIYQSQTNKI